MEIEMTTIPAGTFMMGSNKSSYEQPIHEVEVEEFQMGTYLITFDQYDEYCTATGAPKPSDEGWGRGSRPVINVSWKDVKKFIKWLNKTYPDDEWEYALPTEEQWEYACRAGTTTDYYWGNDPDPTMANYWSEDSPKKTTPVGSYPPNPWGLYDMSGNVWEWCKDKWRESYHHKLEKDR